MIPSMFASVRAMITLWLTVMLVAFVFSMSSCHES